MEKAIIQLDTLSCPSCMQKIEKTVKGLDGVDKESVKVLFNSSKVKAAFVQTEIAVEEIEKTILDLGYSIVKTTVKLV